MKSFSLQDLNTLNTAFADSASWELSCAQTAGESDGPRAEQRFSHPNGVSVEIQCLSDSQEFSYKKIPGVEYACAIGAHLRRYVQEYGGDAAQDLLPSLDADSLPLYRLLVSAQAPGRELCVQDTGALGFAPTSLVPVILGHFYSPLQQLGLKGFQELLAHSFSPPRQSQRQIALDCLKADLLDVLPLPGFWRINASEALCLSSDIGAHRRRSDPQPFETLSPDRLATLSGLLWDAGLLNLILLPPMFSKRGRQLFDHNLCLDIDMPHSAHGRAALMARAQQAQ